MSKHIIVQDAATPKTFERYTSMPEGALYAFDQSIDTRRPYFKTPVKGLYLASASTFPGGGIEAVVISGMICAYDMLGVINIYGQHHSQTHWTKKSEKDARVLSFIRKLFFIKELYKGHCQRSRESYNSI